MERIKEKYKKVVSDIERCIEWSMSEDYNIVLKNNYEYYIDKFIDSLDTYLVLARKELLDRILENGKESIDNEIKTIMNKIDNNENKNTKLYQVSNIDDCIDIINLIIHYDNLKFISNLADI